MSKKLYLFIHYRILKTVRPISHKLKTIFILFLCLSFTLMTFFSEYVYFFFLFFSFLYFFLSFLLSFFSQKSEIFCLWNRPQDPIWIFGAFQSRHLLYCTCCWWFIKHILTLQRTWIFFLYCFNFNYETSVCSAMKSQEQIFQMKAWMDLLYY